jgi:cephalosporin hydroxylase
VRLIIDTPQGKLIQETEAGQRILDLYSKEAFELISQQWIKVGWSQKYAYTFSWMGRPVIQLPEDMIRIQEVIYRVKPDVIVETGIAHGGSLIFYASLCKAIGQGRVIGVDIEIRAHNRRAIEAHQLYPLVTLIEGNSIEAIVIDRVRALVHPGETVMVILDSSHTKEHVLAELTGYSPLVSPGSYIVAADGIMRDLDNVPRGKPEWARDNPAAAAAEFAQKHTEFVLEVPAWPFNESELTQNVTHWPGGWLRRR